MRRERVDGGQGVGLVGGKYYEGIWGRKGIGRTRVCLGKG